MHMWRSGGKQASYKGEWPGTPPHGQSLPSGLACGVAVWMLWCWLFVYGWQMPSGIAAGLNKGFIVQARAKIVKPSNRKGVSSLYYVSH
jgi:hypothetical protein